MEKLTLSISPSTSSPCFRPRSVDALYSKEAPPTTAASNPRSRALLGSEHQSRQLDDMKEFISAVRMRDHLRLSSPASPYSLVGST